MYHNIPLFHSSLFLPRSLLRILFLNRSLYTVLRGCSVNTHGLMCLSINCALFFVMCAFTSIVHPWTVQLILLLEDLLFFRSKNTILTTDLIWWSINICKFLWTQRQKYLFFKLVTLHNLKFAQIITIE